MAANALLLRAPSPGARRLLKYPLVQALPGCAGLRLAILVAVRTGLPIHAHGGMEWEFTILSTNSGSAG